MQRQTAPGFGRVSPGHAATFLAIMSILHAEPAAAPFARFLKKQLQSDDYVLLAHLFEEISVLLLHHLIPEALVFDTFAFDLYWDDLREDILSVRRQTGNEKFCENFDVASDRTRDYRNDRPPKRRTTSQRAAIRRARRAAYAAGRLLQGPWHLPVSRRLAEGLRTSPAPSGGGPGWGRGSCYSWRLATKAAFPASNR